MPEHWRPQTRADCGAVKRPCPYVSCRYNLYLDVSDKSGSIKLNFPTLDPHEMVESCALDVAERDGETLDTLSDFMNLTRERVRQIEIKALGLMDGGMRDHVEDEERRAVRAHQRRQEQRVA